MSDTKEEVIEPLRVILAPGVEMTFQEIPAGEFLMGSRGYDDREEPMHRVRIDKPFHLGTYPVTQRQYGAFRPEHKSGFVGKPDHPVEDVAWYDAVAFCEWLNGNLSVKFPANHVAALPTEAHWEYACRAGTTTEYYTGDGEAALAEAGWWGEKLRTGSTHPVGLKLPNDFGLYDMHGNVREWCRDAWDTCAYRRRWDGITADETFLLNERHGRPAGRVNRGGCWGFSAWNCRAACRGENGAGIRDMVVGFRVGLFSGRLPGQS